MVMEESRKKELIEVLVTRGVENIIPGKEKLLELLNSGKTLNVYLGIDPTATRIHLGHAFPLRKLQIMTELGHNVTFLIGDFTAKVGDTSDKDTERPVLSDEEIKINFDTYKRQAEKFLDFSRVKVVHNSEWLSKLTFGEVLKLTQNFSLNDFISRELIKKRLTDGKRVSLPETLYPIMQGYDSYFMNTDIQFGGTDQTFNMQAGRTLQKNLREKETFVVANGFLSGTDGRKMSKSWGNAIWIEDSAEDVYGKIMSIADEVIVSYYEMGTNAKQEVTKEVRERLASGENPMILKKELAKLIVEELHGFMAVKQAEDHFQKTVVDKTASEETREVKVEFPLAVMGGENSLMAVLLDNRLVSSNSEFKILLSEGAIYLDEVRLVREQTILVPGTVRVGKRKYLKLV
jgi:tyrosyl-tRNA synthetase